MSRTVGSKNKVKRPPKEKPPKPPKEKRKPGSIPPAPMTGEQLAVAA
jgi:hypothetical protein